MFEKIAAMLSEHIDIPVEEITMETTFESLSIDSLDIVEMVMELGDDLGIELELDEKLATVGELVEALEKQVNG